MPLTKVTNSMIDGAFVNVKDMGAKGDGVTDDTEAIQAAINYCKSQLTTVNIGVATLYFPQGLYIVSDTIDVNSVIGFRMVGAGRRTSQIVFTGSSKELFYYNQYLYCTVEEISFFAGSVSFVNGVPQVSGQNPRNNTCFRFNGTGGGTDLVFYDCTFESWDKVFTTVDSQTNDDGHTHIKCSFLSNNIVWDNTNIQAVLWSFYECKVYYNEITVFNNPGNSSVVRGGDFINPGDFVTASIESTGSNIYFCDIRFENYQNIDPTSAPRFLVLSGTKYGIIFERCVATGGGSLTGKTSANLSGLFNVTLRDCLGFSGTWQIDVDASVSSITSLLTLDNTNLTIDQTLFVGQGNRPLNINYINYPNSTLGTINRYFRGASGGQTTPIANTPMVDAITTQVTINNSTATRSIPVFCLPNYNLVLSKVTFVYTNNTNNTFDLIVWKDSTKTIKLGETLGLVANGITKVDTIIPTVWPEFGSTSDPLFVEITSTTNAGSIFAQISFEYQQTY